MAKGKYIWQVITKDNKVVYESEFRKVSYLVKVLKCDFECYLKRQHVSLDYVCKEVC